VTLARRDGLRLEATPLGPAQVHAREHLRPVLRIRASLAGVDREQCVTCVVLPGEERVLLQAVELALERCDERSQLAVGVALRGPLADPLVLGGQAAAPVELARAARALGGAPPPVLRGAPKTG